MPTKSPLSPDQTAAFARDGVLRLEALIPADAIASAREAVLRPLTTLGLWRDGQWRLAGARPPKVARDIGHRHPAVEALIEVPTVKAVVDTLLEGRPFDRTVYRRPQILFSLPAATPWTLPPHWHTDCPRLASGEAPGVQLFTFLQPVEASGGGTLVIAGSHRLLDDGHDVRPADIARALRDEPFFRRLASGGVDLLAGTARGVPLRVVELTGRPGDVWLMDLRALHAGSVNASDRPRLMVTHRFLRADL
ncbi:MAG: phytanoyl-CoA dioxygenase family protein, partial [Pseudomonadota bacterium]